MRAANVQLPTTISAGLLPPLRQTACGCCTTPQKYQKFLYFIEKKSVILKK
jgi:hypothetical protein